MSPRNFTAGLPALASACRHLSKLFTVESHVSLEWMRWQTKRHEYSVDQTRRILILHECAVQTKARIIRSSTIRTELVRKVSCSNASLAPFASAGSMIRSLFLSDFCISLISRQDKKTRTSYLDRVSDAVCVETEPDGVSLAVSLWQ